VGGCKIGVILKKGLKKYFEIFAYISSSCFMVGFE